MRLTLLLFLRHLLSSMWQHRSTPVTKIMDVLEIPDDIWLKVLSSLSSRDVWNIYNSCRRLQQVASDKSLWREVDFRPYCLPLSTLKKIVHLLHKGTNAVRIRGYRKAKLKGPCRDYYMCLSSLLLKTIGNKCPILKTFELHNHFIDAAKLPVTCFPRSVVDLKLCNSVILNPPERKSYFHDISSVMPNITTLSLEGSQVDDSALMPISKLEKLKTLTLKNCRETGACIAYVATSAYGFRALEVLDVRLTKFHDSTVHALKKIKTLKELYLDGLYLKGPGSSSLDCLSDRLVMVFEGEPSGLNILHIRNSDVTDLTLSFVPRVLPQLKELNLEGSGRLSQGALQELKLVKPKLMIKTDLDH